MKYIFSILLFISSLSAFNFNISDSTITNGRTAIIVFDKEESIKYDKLVMGKNNFKIFNHPIDTKKMYALLPVSYYKKPTIQKAELIYKKSNEKLSKILFFKIEDGEYKKETIEVQKSKVNPKSEEVKKKNCKRVCSGNENIFNYNFEELCKE